MPKSSTKKDICLAAELIKAKPLLCITKATTTTWWLMGIFSFMERKKYEENFLCINQETEGKPISLHQICHAHRGEGQASKTSVLDLFTDCVFFDEEDPAFPTSVVVENMEQKKLLNHDIFKGINLNCITNKRIMHSRFVIGPDHHYLKNKTLIEPCSQILIEIS